MAANTQGEVLDLTAQLAVYREMDEKTAVMVEAIHADIEFLRSMYPVKSREVKHMLDELSRIVEGYSGYRKDMLEKIQG